MATAIASSKAAVNETRLQNADPPRDDSQGRRASFATLQRPFAPEYFNTFSPINWPTFAPPQWPTFTPPLTGRPVPSCLRRNLDVWKDPANNPWLQSFAIVTVPASSFAASIHVRMPAILLPADYDQWLDHAEVEHTPSDLLEPFERAGMVRSPAHPKVGNVRNPGPEMLNSA